jgi:NAD-dependent dihydropyrimidine dehydrogenase PreA subunit
MKRNIIAIDPEKCTGCGLCIPNCPEGAIQIIDNKARLISDLFCDGLGACLGHCPEGAIIVEQREAADYSEREVMKNIVKQGPNVISKSCGCPGAQSRTIVRENTNDSAQMSIQLSQLRQWPVQLHLISPLAEYFKNSDVLLVADCVAYALGDFHDTWLKGKTITIACPKLDEGKDSYREKLTALIDKANIATLTVMTMEVPCCSGLLRLAEEATSCASRKIPIKSVIVGIEGEIKNEM